MLAYRTPNGLFRGYGNPEHSYWLFAPTWHPKSCETRFDHINYHFRQGERHKYAWDEETLTRSLQQARFICVTRRPFDALLDSEDRKLGILICSDGLSGIIWRQCQIAIVREAKRFP
jgi:hypothetical protein